MNIKSFHLTQHFNLYMQHSEAHEHREGGYMGVAKQGHHASF